MKKLPMAVCLLVLSMAALEVRADSRVSTVKSRVNQVLAVLKDPALKSDSTKELKKKRLRAIFDNTFDYAELSRATLSRFMVLKNNQWWCYDFVIENISVVANYRSQFGRILTKESPEKMLEDLRKNAI